STYVMLYLISVFSSSKSRVHSTHQWFAIRTCLPSIVCKEEPCRTATKTGSEPNRRQAGPSEAIKKSKFFSVPVRRLHNQNPILRILFILSSFRNLPLTKKPSL